VGQVINVEFRIINDTTFPITYFDSRGASWYSFKEEWILSIDSKFKEVFPLNGKFASNYTNTTFITLLPGEERVIRTKQFVLDRAGSYTLVYKQQQAPQFVDKTYRDSTVTDSIIATVSTFEISKMVKFEVYKSYDTTITKLNKMTWEDWREFRHAKLYSQEKHFDNMYAALKYPEDVYSLKLMCRGVGYNEIKRIGEFKNLRALTLRDYPFNTFPKELVDLKLYELTIIPIEDTVVSFPYGMSKDSSIRELTAKFYGNAIDSSVLALKELTYLNVSNCPIGEVLILGSLTDLKELVANNTGLTDIGNIDFEKLTSLKKLNLSGNRKIISLTPILECANLEFLIINRTSIEEIPDDIDNLSKLKRISISSSVIHVSDSIGNLTDLRYLSLSGNRKLDSIPNSIANLKRLIYLDISNTNINVLPSGVSELPLKQLRLYNTDCKKTKDYKTLKRQLGSGFKE
jgi:hypothetical protein